MYLFNKSQDIPVNFFSHKSSRTAKRIFISVQGSSLAVQPGNQFGFAE